MIPASIFGLQLLPDEDRFVGRIVVSKKNR